MATLKVFPGWVSREPGRRSEDERMAQGVAVSYQINPTKALEYMDEEQLGALCRVAMSKAPLQRMGKWLGTALFLGVCTTLLLAVLAVIRWLWPYAVGSW